MRKYILIGAVSCAACFLAGAAGAAGNGAEAFDFTPDTGTLKTGWKDFFNDPVYTRLSTETQKGLTDRLFTELIAGDTGYMAWPAELQAEARKIFYTKAGFPPAGAAKDEAAKLPAEKLLIDNNPQESPGALALKEKRLAEALARDGEAKLPSPPADADKKVKPTEIPRTDVEKFPMPVGRSWFKNDPLEELESDPDFIGYIVLMNSRKYRR